MLAVRQPRRRRCAVALPARRRAAADAGFGRIFNGKDLTGWKGKEGFWSVKDGAITGETTEKDRRSNTFLVWQGGESTDFELRLSSSSYGGNSGIQYRSKVHRRSDQQVGGYQADFDAGNEVLRHPLQRGRRRGRARHHGRRGTKTTGTTARSDKDEPLAMTTRSSRRPSRTATGTST